MHIVKYTYQSDKYSHINNKASLSRRPQVSEFRSTITVIKPTALQPTNRDMHADIHTHMHAYIHTHMHTHIHSSNHVDNEMTIFLHLDLPLCSMHRDMSAGQPFDPAASGE